MEVEAARGRGRGRKEKAEAKEVSPPSPGVVEDLTLQHENRYYGERDVQFKTFGYDLEMVEQNGYYGQEEEEERP